MSRADSHFPFSARLWSRSSGGGLSFPWASAKCRLSVSLCVYCPLWVTLLLWSLILLLSGCQDPSDSRTGVGAGEHGPHESEHPLGRDKLTPDSHSQGLIPSFRALKRFGIIPFIKLHLSEVPGRLGSSPLGSETELTRTTCLWSKGRLKIPALAWVGANPVH